ncbi:hypothetical protein [Bradyrhizobium sp. HKCCYLS20291]|uniref:hypothetical protein n=1 Tax=Bradyrhizobium sp. HKCCYLS20291 TaxID=3420766 RepID=UPI003EC0541B
MMIIPGDWGEIGLVLAVAAALAAFVAIYNDATKPDCPFGGVDCGEPSFSHWNIPGAAVAVDPTHQNIESL